jgi:predicted AAA+ superfamily ATPase
LFGEDMTLSPGAMPALNDAFWEYVNFGGFPKDAAMRVFHCDLAARSGIGDPRDLDKLFAILARNTASEVTIEKLVSAVGVAKNTLRKYLDFLEQAFLIRRLPRLDRDGKRF